MTTTPNYIVTTGDFITEWMEDAGINAAELARRLGVSRKHFSELLAGKAPLSANLAIALERVTGVPARLWNAYEAGYRDDLARRKTPEDVDAAYDQAKGLLGARPAPKARLHALTGRRGSTPAPPSIRYASARRRSNVSASMRRSLTVVSRCRR
jgi:addiction module HigA family antidote